MKAPSDLIKKAQDLIEQVFQEQEGEGEVIQQSPFWMRATLGGLWARQHLRWHGSQLPRQMKSSR